MRVKFDRDISLKELFELFFNLRCEDDFIYYDDRKLFSVVNNSITISPDKLGDWWFYIQSVIELYEIAFPEVEVSMNVVTSDCEFKNISFLSDEGD